MCKKGQIAIMDMILSLMVMFFVIVALFFMHQNYQRRIDNKVEFNKLQSQSSRFLKILIETPGDPVDWEYDAANAKSYGLVQEKNVIDENKLSAFTSLNYDDLKNKLNIFSNFYFVVKDLNNTVYGEIGRIPIGEVIINVQRRVLFNDEYAIAEVVMFK